jgi:hypothetical protein
MAEENYRDLTRRLRQQWEQTGHVDARLARRVLGDPAAAPAQARPTELTIAGERPKR